MERELESTGVKISELREAPGQRAQLPRESGLAPLLLGDLAGGEMLIEPVEHYVLDTSLDEV